MKHATFITIAILLLFLAGCGRGSDAELSDEGAAIRTEEAPSEATSPSLAASADVDYCEHDVPRLECDNCRWEAGGVLIADDLVRDGLVRWEKVQLTGGRNGIEATGEVAFDEGRIVHISPRIGGVARKVHVTLGDTVRTGQALVEIDSLELDELRSRYRQALSGVELAERNHEREHRLHEKRVSSDRELQESENALADARIGLESAAEKLRLLGFTGADLESIADNGAGMVLRAPMSGTLVSSHVVPGERLDPGGEIMTVADLSVVWVWASVYERDLAPLLDAGSTGKRTAVVQVAAFPGREFPGTVDYVGALMDEATRTVKVRIIVPNPDRLLRPGMFADVSIPLEASSPALLLPEEAVMEDGLDRFVFVRAGESLFLRRDVRGAAPSAGRTEILHGLEPGEEVVVHGAFLLKSDILREKMGAGCAD